MSGNATLRSFLCAATSNVNSLEHNIIHVQINTCYVGGGAHNPINAVFLVVLWAVDVEGILTCCDLADGYNILMLRASRVQEASRWRSVKCLKRQNLH